MNPVFTKCPVTGQMFAAGIETDMASLARSPRFVARARCPYCKTEHEWSNETAWIADGSGKLTRPTSIR